jgi:sirohydrochlorin ferrochelatase/formylmethanofuran dehydrogenase subunit E
MLGTYTRCNIRRNISITKQYINVNVILLAVMITCVGIAGADISSANWHADAGESITGIDSDNNQTKIGVLIIAHGSSSESWCAPVRATVANVSLPYPVELGFLEKVPGESIGDAVDKLSSHGVSEIVAVPLFVSSSSNHISEIEYILGLGDAIPGEEDLVQVNTTANITLTGAMDDHWIISSILADNTADFGEDPCNETAVLVSHGVSDDEAIFIGWNESSASLAEQTLLRLRHIHNLDIEGVRYSFINLNETIHPEFAVRAVVEEISSNSTPIVLSRILSPGYHTKKKIPTLLENLTYLYDNETTLATHPALAEWIDITVYEAVSDLSFTVYNGENGEVVELTIEEAVAGHEGGKLCPCVAVAWRASQFALSEVWSDVDQSDLKITSAHPSDGHEETFLYILNNSTADYTIEMPEGTDPKNLTTDNYVYTFTSKSTGDSVTVHVKDDVFPDKLFDLRKKCKAGTATPDEKKAFKLIKDELKDGFLYLPMDELFDAEVEHARSDTGVLIIAHGSSSESWCAPVRATVANVSLPYPVELGFLEGVPGESIEDAADKLSSHGVSEIVAIPLFVSSSSNHIGEIEYILGLGDAIPGEEDLVQVNTTANITLTGAMDDHWIISSILANHAADLSEDPCNETVVTISHGVSDNEEIFVGWNESGASLAEQTLLRLRYHHNLDIGGSRHSLARLNETLHPEIAARAVVEDVSATSTPVVLPLFLSTGYNTNTKIPAMLENLTYVYDNEKTLAAHPALAEWIDITVYEAVSDLSFSVYDGESGEIVELTIEGAAAMHDGGKLCPSVAASWRASQLALSDIWGCIPRSDLEITSAHPSDGHEATFLYILENSTDDYVVEMPEGADITNISTENYVYTFVRKSTGDSVTVRVKDDVIPAEFLELRKKIRAKTATPEEIKVFKLIKDELKARLMYLPACELFDSEVAYSKFDTGILVVAHGSPREMWCAPVRAAAHNVDLPYPVELGFLEFAPGETINAAVDRLDKHGVKKIIAVPLFVSSHSDHIAEVEYVLGLRDSLPGAHSASEMGVMSSADERAGMITFASGKEVMRSVVQRGDKYFISRVAVAGHPGGDEEEELVPVKTDAAITLTGAIDDHWLVGEILADRARALSTNPEGETVVLVAHGADNETDIAPDL